MLDKDWTPKGVQNADLKLESVITLSLKTRFVIQKKITGVLQQDVVQNGIFDMELCLRKFSEHFSELFTKSDSEFLEKHGRLVFLSFLKPLINGQGFYHIESSFTNLWRMDIVVNFNQQQFIIELKIWHGNVKHLDAYEQLSGYMDNRCSIPIIEIFICIKTTFMA